MDLDSGCDATWSLGFDASDGALDIFKKRSVMADVFIDFEAEGLLLLLGSPALERLEDGDVSQLAKRLREIGKGKDHIFVIDTPPGFSPVATRAAIAAADVAAALHVEPTILGIAVMVDARRSLTAAVLEQARIGGLPAIAEVPRAVVVPESANVAKSILEYASTPPASEAYRAAADVIRKALGIKAKQLNAGTQIHR